MSGHEVSFLATRLLALLVGVSAVRHVLVVAGDLVLRGPSRAFETAWSIGPIVSGIAAAWLWWFADRIATRLTATEDGRDADDDQRASVRAYASTLDIYSIALSLLGFYVLMVGLSNAGTAIAQAITPPPRGFGQEALDTLIWLPHAITAGLHVLLGVVLAASPRALAVSLQARWRYGRGLVSAKAVELVDEAGMVRATLGVEQDEEGREDVAVTIHDEGYAPRVRVGTVGGADGVVQFLDDDGGVLRTIRATREESAP